MAGSERISLRSPAGVPLPVLWWRDETVQTSASALANSLPSPVEGIASNREVAGRMGCEIVKVYKDHGISGAKGRNGRPAFDALCLAK